MVSASQHQLPHTHPAQRQYFGRRGEKTDPGTGCLLFLLCPPGRKGERIGPGLMLPSPTAAGAGGGPRGPPGGKPHSGAARTAAPAPPGAPRPPSVPSRSRGPAGHFRGPGASGLEPPGAERPGREVAGGCRSARRAGTGAGGAGAGAGGARSAPSGPALPLPAGRGAVPPKGRAASGRAARCPPGTVRVPSQLQPSLPSALRQRQESLEKPPRGFPTPAGET